MEAWEREQRLQTVFLFILSAIAIGGALYLLRPVMIPFVLALFFTLLMTPSIDLQEKYLKVPHKLATFNTLIFGVALLILLGIIIAASVAQLAAYAASYQSQIEELLRKGAALLHTEQFGVDVRSVATPLLQTASRNVGSMLLEGINSVFQFLSTGVLVFIFVLFLLLGKAKAVRPRTRVFRESEAGIKRYIVAKVIISAVTGLLVWTVLAVLGIQPALVFGLAAFVLNFIPSIGSIIATLLPLPVVVFNPEISTAAAILSIALPGAVQFTIGNIIEPKVMGQSLDLHPVVILLALIFWGMIWGVVGMLLAAPLTAIMKIVFEHLELTSPLAHMLAGRLPEEAQS